MAPSRFLCDEMLMRLGRWLRAAGYDTAIAPPGSDDRKLVEQARAESRWLITRDRHLARFRNGDGRVVLLEANDTPSLAAELSRRFPIDWLNAPFSRCLDCNTPCSRPPRSSGHRSPKAPSPCPPTPGTARAVTRSSGKAATCAACDTRWRTSPGDTGWWRPTERRKRGA